MRQGQGLYQGGVGQQYYPGQTVAPFSGQTQYGLDAMTQRAMYGSPVEQGMQDYLTGQLGQQQYGLGGAYGGASQYLNQIGAGQQALGAAAQPGADPYGGALGNIIGGAPDLGAASQFAGGATAPWQTALGGMTQFGGLGEAQQFAGTPQAGALPASQQAVQRLMQQGIDPRASQQLGATAGGQFLGSNPYLDQAAQQIQQRAGREFSEDIAPAIAAQFGGAGRARRGAAGVGGAGIQGDVLGGAAADMQERLAGQLASQVYMPAYESERGRQEQAAGQLGQLGLGAGGLQAQAAGLGGQLYGTQAGAELGRGQLASQQYLGERGLAQQAAQAGGQLGLGGGQLAASLYGTGGQQALGAIGQGQDWQQGGLDRQLQAGLGMQQGGLGGIGALGDIYGDQTRAQLGAAQLAPQAGQLDYQNIDQLMRAGAISEDQAQRMMDAERQRFDFYQQAPWQSLGQYSNIVNQMPAGLGTTIGTPPSGSRAAGAMGGAMAGAGAGSMLGPWGALGGGIVGGLGGLFGE